jgi:hypothetical protein
MIDSESVQALTLSDSLGPMGLGLRLGLHSARLSSLTGSIFQTEAWSPFECER